MDELVQTFNSQLVSDGKSKDSNFKNLYKNLGKLENQEERRKELLKVQKNERNRQLDNLRGILELVDHSENTIFSGSKKSYYKPSIYVAGFNKTSYKNILMLSEWIVEKPEDFNEDWYITPCPKGTRVLVIGYNGTTKFFTKYGQFRFQVGTLLPGGGHGEDRKQACCVLDGFYQQKNNTFYALDVLAWNNQTVTDCEMEFRHFWLSTKIQENPGLSVLKKNNKVIFKVLPKTPCDPESLNQYLMKYPPFPDNFPELDGFLFFHKRAHYVSGETPLVGWLFPYMLKEVLGSDVTINPQYDSGKPSDYTNQADFIENFSANQQQRQNTRKNTKIGKKTSTDEASNSENMDADDNAGNSKSSSRKVSESMDSDQVSQESQNTKKESELMESEVSQAMGEKKIR